MGTVLNRRAASRGRIIATKFSILEGPRPKKFWGDDFWFKRAVSELRQEGHPIKYSRKEQIYILLEG